MTMVMREKEQEGHSAGVKLPDGGLVEGPWQTGMGGRRGPASRFEAVMVKQGEERA